MDSNRYRDAVKKVIEAYAKLRPSHGNINLEVVFDEKNDRFALMQSGWDRGRRVRGNLIYITLEGQKVNIEYDGIEHGIVDDLVKNGVPEKDIVLSFLPENSMPTAA